MHLPVNGKRNKKQKDVNNKFLFVFIDIWFVLHKKSFSPQLFKQAEEIS
jgi:hypothetical protein